MANPYVFLALGASGSHLEKKRTLHSRKAVVFSVIIRFCIMPIVGFGLMKLMNITNPDYLLIFFVISTAPAACEFLMIAFYYGDKPNYF